MIEYFAVSSFFASFTCIFCGPTEALGVFLFWPFLALKLAIKGFVNLSIRLDL
jgi:hypothetical protein